MDWHSIAEHEQAKVEHLRADIAKLETAHGQNIREIDRLRSELAARDELLRKARECIDIHNHGLAARIDAALAKGGGCGV